MKSLMVWFAVAGLTIATALTQGTGSPVALPDTPAALPSPIVDGECQRWAEDLGLAFVPDSITMHQLGCDDGRLTEGVYIRVDGACNEAARRAYRNGIPFPADGFFQYVESFGCEVMEDGSWNEVN